MLLWDCYDVAQPPEKSSRLGWEWPRPLVDQSSKWGQPMPQTGRMAGPFRQIAFRETQNKVYLSFPCKIKIQFGSFWAKSKHTLSRTFSRKCFPGLTGQIDAGRDSKLSYNIRSHQETGLMSGYFDGKESFLIHRERVIKSRFTRILQF